jgi:hypothetical protein
MQTPPHSRRNSAIQSPSVLRDPKLLSFPVADLLAALFIDTLPEGMAIADIKETMCNAVEAVLTEAPPSSPSPTNSNPSFRRVKEDIACQVPIFLKTLNQVHNGRGKRKSGGTENPSTSPKKKRKSAPVLPDPASFSEEELSEDDDLNCEASTFRN